MRRPVAGCARGGGAEAARRFVLQCAATRSILPVSMHAASLAPLVDRRRSPRAEVAGIEASCDEPGIRAIWAVADLSHGGALLEGGPLPAVGARLGLALVSKAGVVRVPAIAVRHAASAVGHPRAGVAFSDPTAAADAFVADAVERSAAAPTAVVLARYGWPARRLTTTLRLAGFRPAIATHAADANARLAAERPIAVIVDPAVPGALRVLALARRTRPDARRLLASGPIVPATAERALRAGLAHADLGATWTVPDLARAIGERGT
ncbi:MAG: PilZ domain-containing protein [Deltaproteobacteria bacterium]|nr:MAG: PilZ domain-containing protein [Deltaproteobacteria bacterium]